MPQGDLRHFHVEKYILISVVVNSCGFLFASGEVADGNGLCINGYADLALEALNDPVLQLVLVNALFCFNIKCADVLALKVVDNELILA